ncbi:MAG: hypothetical protein BroJett022_03880 [Actinomycetes bacterium]|nr:MAG: hypothetical protein BroJett022_03880 [Actinomycetes bacterium]
MPHCSDGRDQGRYRHAAAELTLADPFQAEALVSSARPRRDSLTRWALLVSDLLSIEIALLVAGLAASERPEPMDLALYGLAMLPVWALLFKVYGLYDRDIKRISHAGIDDIPAAFHALIVGTLAFWYIMKVAPSEQMLFAEVAGFAIVSLPLILAMRALTRRAVLAALGGENVLIAANGIRCEIVARKLNAHPEYGQHPQALLVPADGGAIPRAATRIAEPWVGGAAELGRRIATGRFDRVIVARDDYPAAEVLSMINLCRRYCVKIGVIPSATDAFGPSLELDEIEGLTVLGVTPPVLSRTSRILKRGFDLAVAVPILVLTSPVMAAAAIAIRFDSPGPALFRQARVGHRSKVFTLLKLRTMVDGADRQRAELMKESKDPNWLHLRDDPRITRVGSFLRRISVDELPQLINVIRGEMSLVGPRPLPESEDANVKGWDRGRLDLVPGITGLWQVLGRTSIPFQEMVKLDYVYVANWTLWMDMRLLMRTLPAMLRRRGVN